MGCVLLIMVALQVTPTDPGPYLAAVAVVMAIGAVGPARRGAGIDPLAMLRE